MKTRRAKTNKRPQQPLPRPITTVLQRLKRRPKKSNPPNSKRQLKPKKLLQRKTRRRFNHRLQRSKRSHQKKRMIMNMTMSHMVPQMKRTKKLFLKIRSKRGKWNISQKVNNQILKIKRKMMMRISSSSLTTTKRPNTRLPNRRSLPSKSLPNSSRNLNKRRRVQIKWPLKTMPHQLRPMSLLQPHKLPQPKRRLLINMSSHPKEKYSNTFLSPRRPLLQMTVWVIGKSTKREQRRKSRRTSIVMTIQTPATEVVRYLEMTHRLYLFK